MKNKESQEQKERDITAEVTKLSSVSNEAVHFLLSKHEITKINAVHSTRRQIPIPKIKRGRGKKNEK